MSTGTVVLGAGPAGLAFAYRYGRGAVVLEKSPEVGGLSRSIEIEDGVFDIGGHSFHTPHPEVLALVRGLMKEAWHEHPRDARVWVSGELIPYPFQRHFEMLDNQTIVEDCRGHVVDSASVARSRNFEEWIFRRFGNGVAKNFMLPYNRKQWACDLKDMSCEWVIERVATDTGHATGTIAAGPTRRPLQSDSRVGYPAQGGFGAIFVALAAQCDRIELGQDVVQIDLERRVVHTAAGQVWPWKRIVSTIPLPVLLGCIRGCPERIVKLASTLGVVSLKILLILARLRGDRVPQRIYIADPTIPPHKVTFNHTSSPSLAERRNHAIMCEVSYSPDKPAQPDATLLKATVDWLIANRFIVSSDDIVAQKVVDVRYGYPVPTHAKQAIVARITKYLEQQEIYTIGRFGSWSYVNSDECIHQGMALAQRLRHLASDDKRA
jgi:protoporphyrinogen oxidase